MKRPPVTGDEAFLVVRSSPKSYQRFSKASTHGGRFVPREIQEYQDQITRQGAKMGLHTKTWGRHLLAEVWAFIAPLKYEEKDGGPWGLSENPKDVDNLTKAALDGLKLYFNDRYVSVGHIHKLWVRDPSLQAVIIRLSNADSSAVAQQFLSRFEQEEEAQPWVRCIQTPACS